MTSSAGRLKVVEPVADEWHDDNAPEALSQAGDTAADTSQAADDLLPTLVVVRGPQAVQAAPSPSSPALLPVRRPASHDSQLLRVLANVFAALALMMIIGAVAALYRPDALVTALGQLGLEAAVPIVQVAQPPAVQEDAAQGRGTPVTAPVVPRAIVGLGRLLPHGDVVRVAPPSGAGDARITELLVSEGDRAAAGDVLAVLDNAARLSAAVRTAEADVAVKRALLDQARNDIVSSRDQARAALRSAEAQAETARVDLARAQTLFDKDIIAKAAYDQKLLVSTQAERAVEEARAALARFEAESMDEQPDVVVVRRQLEAAEANLERARADLEQSRVRAPISGTVLDVHARPGEKPGTEGILDMGDVDRMAANVEIYESDIGRVEVGDPVTITAAALSEPLRGWVERIGLQVKRQSVIDADPAANTDARVVEVWVALDPSSSREAARFTNLQVRAQIEAGIGP